MTKFRRNNAQPVWCNHTGLTRINYKERYTYRDVAHFMYRKITNAHGDYSINNAEVKDFLCCSECSTNEKMEFITFILSEFIFSLYIL